MRVTDIKVGETYINKGPGIRKRKVLELRAHQQLGTQIYYKVEDGSDRRGPGTCWSCSLKRFAAWAEDTVENWQKKRLEAARNAPEGWSMAVTPEERRILDAEKRQKQNKEG